MGGWQPVTDTDAATERYEDMRHFMTDPRTVTGMADREQGALGEMTVRGGNGAAGATMGGGGASETSGTAPGGAGGGIYWDPANTHVISDPLSFTANDGSSHGQDTPAS
jgi:hypothetical protein